MKKGDELFFELDSFMPLKDDKKFANIIDRYEEKQGVSYIAFTFHGTAPYVNRKGMAITYPTHLNSVNTAKDTLIDYEHLATDLPTGATETVVLGHICDLFVDDDDLRRLNQWIIPGIIPTKPVITRGIMALYDRIENVAELVKDIKEGKQQWYFSLEIGDVFTPPEIWLVGNDQSPDEFYSFDDAPEEIKKAALEPKETTFNGRKIAYLMGGRNGKLNYIGGAITRYPAGYEQLEAGNALKFICNYRPVEEEMKTAVWKSLEDVPERLKTIDGVPLTLAQINHIAEVAEAVEREGTANGWAVAKARFKETHYVKNGRWVKKMTKVTAAEWDTAYINNLPDSCFAVIEGDYKSGKTKDKRCRHLPFKDKDGKVDLPHLRNAFARLNQITPVSGPESAEELKEKARRVLERYRKYLLTEKKESSDEDIVFAEIALEDIDDFRTMFKIGRELMFFSDAAEGSEEEVRNKSMDEEITKDEALEKLKEELKNELINSGEFIHISQLANYVPKEEVDKLVEINVKRQTRENEVNSLSLDEEIKKDLLCLLSTDMFDYTEEGDKEFASAIERWKRLSLVNNKKQETNKEEPQQEEMTVAGMYRFAQTFNPGTGDANTTTDTEFKRWGM